VRRFSEIKYLPHPSLDLFDIIVDVDKYAEFLPWCVASRVRQRNVDGSLIADLSIGYGSLREKFTSSISSDRKKLSVVTTQAVGPFRHLRSEWWLLDVSDGRTKVSFEIEFEFRSFLLEKLIGAIFESAAHKMISAFERRAADIL
jgi:coenzyme Q-binding protein COQ10